MELSFGSSIFLLYLYTVERYKQGRAVMGGRVDSVLPYTEIKQDEKNPYLRDSLYLF